MRLVMVTGSYPPMRCGVGDYTSHLCRGLARVADLTLVTSPGAVPDNGQGLITAAGWALWRMPALAWRIARRRPDVVHIQYPTIGYGYSTGPQALAFLLWLLRVRAVVTMHEFKHARLLRRLSCLPLVLFSRGLVFTAETELECVARWLPFMRRGIERKSWIIPVGPGIFPAEAPRKRTLQGGRITAAFFGLFYPGRLIEQCVEAFRLASLRIPGLRIVMAGDMHPRHVEYFESTRAEAAGALPREQVTWALGKGPGELARTFEGVDVFLLPYPGGASMRRTSLLSAMSFGAAVITTEGADTPEDLRDGENVLFASDPSGMAERLVELSSSPELFSRISSAALLTAERFSWDKISESHMEMYGEVLR